MRKHLPTPKHRERASFTMSENEHTATEKRDVYATVTAQIVNAIEQGVSNWRMPWHTSGKFAFSPINVTQQETVSGYQYRLLVGRCEAKGGERMERARISNALNEVPGSQRARLRWWCSGSSPRCSPKRRGRRADRQRFTAAVHTRLFGFQRCSGRWLHA